MKTAVVTGANRGIGKEIARQLAERGFRVIATGRNLKNVQNAVREIGKSVFAFQTDVADPKSCQLLHNFIAENFPCVDVLVNNAGIYEGGSAIDFDIDRIRKVLETNFFGVMNVTRALWPLLRKSKDARVINLSSGMGAMKDMHSGGYDAYRLSKWSLNGWTMLLAADAPASIKVNSMCPGWVRTDMGGPQAPRSPEQGAETAVWLATEPEIPTGKFWRDKKIIDW